MSKFALLASAAALVVSALPAQAAIFSFSTSLSGLGEPVPTSTATGSALVTFDDVAGTVNVSVSFSGIATSTGFGHIHCCTATAGTGSVGVKLGFNALPAATSGIYTDTFTPSAVVFSDLLIGTTAGKAYVNIHTPGTYASGEIRGFLAPVPEPESYALMLAGLGVVALLARRRRSA